MKLLTGYEWGSSDPQIVFTICAFIYLYSRCKVYSCLFNQTKIIFSQQVRPQPSVPSSSNTYVSVDHTTPHHTTHQLTHTTPHHTTPHHTPAHSHHTTPHHAPAHSHRSPTRLPALVTQFRYLLPTVSPFKSLCMHPLVSPTVSWMYVDCLNLRRTVPNCPQLTPAMGLSVVPTIFGYTEFLKENSRLEIQSATSVIRYFVSCTFARHKILRLLGFFVFKIVWTLSTRWKCI